MITLVIGNAISPIAIVPIIYAAADFALGLYFVVWKPMSQLDWIALTALAIRTLAMAATGIGIKPGNSVFLLPLIFTFIHRFKVCHRSYHAASSF